MIASPPWKFVCPLARPSRRRSPSGRAVSAVQTRQKRCRMSVDSPCGDAPDWISLAGNIRELESVLEKAAVAAHGGDIDAGHVFLPRGPLTGYATPAATSSMPNLCETLAGIERLMIDDALQRVHGNQAKAAQILGIPRTTLRDKMAKYGFIEKGGSDQP